MQTMQTLQPPTSLAAELRLPTNGLDYTILAIYFVVVLGIGIALVLKSLRSIRQIDPLPRTRETLREDKSLLQEQLR